MAGNKHLDESTRDPDNLPDDLDLMDDPLLSASFKNLSKVYVPSEFLPNVMFRVYEKHHRDRISPAQVIASAMGLLLLCLGFLVWDVMDLQAAANHPDFGTAWAHKIDLILIDSAELLDAASGILTAAWQIVTNVAGMFFTNTPLIVQLVLLAAVIGLGVMIRRWLSR